MVRGSGFPAWGLGERRVRREDLTGNSDVEVQGELVGVRAKADGVDLLFAFVPDPGTNDVVGEDITLKQELVVALQVGEGLLQRRGRLGDPAQLLGLEVVNVLVERFAG